MPVLFANPAGFWALLAIPAILIIHFLQRESKRYHVSTLFLLDLLEKESVKGRRIDRLRQSIPLWLQLLASLLGVWLLVQPRWASTHAVQRVVIVLDDSASMSAFREELKIALAKELPRLTRFTGTTEYTVLESSAAGRTLFRGTALRELNAALDAWLPTAGSHNWESALQAGRGLAGTGGVLLFATDHPGEPLSHGAIRLAVGTRVANVGFTGASVEGAGAETMWKATLKNHSAHPQTRSWFLASGMGRTESRLVELEAGATRTLQGRFPEANSRVTLILEPDRFEADDRLDLLVPSSKILHVARAGAAGLEPLVNDLAGSLESVALAQPGIEPDFWFSSYNPLSPSGLPPVSVVFLHQEQVPRIFLSGVISEARHALVSDLDWQGLIARSTPSLPMEQGDQPLLWQGERVMVLLRETKGRKQLVFNFDVATSNAVRLPAFVVLIHRFANLLRKEKVAVEMANVEWNQHLAVAHAKGTAAPPLTFRTNDGTRTVPLIQARFLRAPDSHGFFEILQGNEPLLIGASNFADVREADFSRAGAISEIGGLPERLKERQTRDDLWRPLWILLLTLAILLAWSFLLSPRSRTRPSSGQQELGIP